MLPSSATYLAPQLPTVLCETRQKETILSQPPWFLWHWLGFSTSLSIVHTRLWPTGGSAEAHSLWSTLLQDGSLQQRAGTVRGGSGTFSDHRKLQQSHPSKLFLEESPWSSPGGVLYFTWSQVAEEAFQDWAHTEVFYSCGSQPCLLHSALCICSKT